MSEVSETLVESTGPISAEAAPGAAPEQAAPEEIKPEAPKQDDKFASKFAALSRKEKTLREQERNLQQTAQRLKAMETELKKMQEERNGADTSLKARLKSDPLKVLAEEGLTYEELSERVLNDGNPTPQRMIEQMRSELQREYKSELEALKQQIREKEENEQKKQYETAENNFKAELKQYIDGNEKYELTKANGAYDLAFDVAKEYYDQTGKVLSYEEAADLVEGHLEEEANRILQLKKIQSKIQKPPQPPVEAKPASPTLSNKLSAEQPVKGERRLSNEESLREAAKLIRWEE